MARPLKITLVSFALPLFCFGRLPEHRLFVEMVSLFWLSATYAIAARSGNLGLRDDAEDA
ncbi:MAG: hypothetical protein WBL23_04790 [Salinisphaera sp.]|uniref:hypothetical protein n=1 Tax=Salinisphaera sp. TaxID=1914330 RepID=UPI003C797989